MPKAYWIARMDVRDVERYKDYVAGAAFAFQKYNAKFLVRGGMTHALEGQARGRNVVIEFASMADALACYNEPTYQEAKKIRAMVADGELMIVEGFEA